MGALLAVRLARKILDSLRIELEAVWYFTDSSAVLAHVEIAETYSTESFLMAMRRFMALYGAPKRFQSDQGPQLVAASKQMATWDWSSVHETAEKVGAEWHVVPTGGQHYNGQAERPIGLLKKCLESTMARRRITLGELSTVVAEAARRSPVPKPVWNGMDCLR